MLEQCTEMTFGPIYLGKLCIYQGVGYIIYLFVDSGKLPCKLPCSFTYSLPLACAAKG